MPPPTGIPETSVTANVTASEASQAVRDARRRSLRNEWILLAILTVVAAILLGRAGGIPRTDRLIYDRLMESAERPAAANIVIVAVDDKSIAALGRWPWARGTHAQLLNVLANGNPKAIGMDIILTESETANNGLDDRALAVALAKNHRTVLPVLLAQTDSGVRAIPPLPAFAAAAARLAHIHLNFDNDGVVRSTYLYEGIDGQRWPEFALALLLTGGDTAAYNRTRFKRNADRASKLPQQLERSDRLRIPFAGPPGHFRTVSYIDVLNGTVPADFFQNKYVLVGATAVGSGDVFPTPLAAQDGLMSGIEMHANLLAALMEGLSIDNVPLPLAILFTAAPALLILIGFIFMSPRVALLLTAVYAVAVCAISYAAFRYGIWLAPSGALLLLFLIYPVWSWRRLEAALNYLNEEVQRLGVDAPYVSGNIGGNVSGNAAANAAAGKARLWDFLERRIEAMRAATRRMRDLHRFVSDNMNSMPDANLVIDNDGVLMLHNRKAQDLFLSLNLTPARGGQIDDLLAPFEWPRLPASHDRSWHRLLTRAGVAQAGIETRDAMNRIFLVKSSPSQKANGEPLGWIVSLADISMLRATERLRDESLNFISHDIRAPQSSILAMLELQRSAVQPMPLEELFGRIEKSVRSTLGLAEDFVQLAKAEASEYQLEEVDFVAVLADATDEMWALANARHVRLTTEVTPDAYWVRADRSLLVRALCNLLSNAIKYGPDHAEVQCTLRVIRAGGQATLHCAISDRGNGISAADSARLFTPFYRVGGSAESGAGLGLAFVRTVMQQHGGAVAFVNNPAQGATFIVTLPCAEADAEAQE